MLYRRAKRTAAIASLGMAGGIGQLIAFPYTHLLIEYTGWQMSLLVLAATGLMMLPLAYVFSGKPAEGPGILRSLTTDGGIQGGLRASEFLAADHRLLRLRFSRRVLRRASAGVSSSDKGLPAWVGVWSLMAVGITNIIGHLYVGAVRQVRREAGRPQLYLFHADALPFIGLLYLPMTPAVVIGISALLGIVLAVDGAVDVRPGGAVFRHAMDVDAVMGRVLVAPTRVVCGIVACGPVL